MEGVGQAVRAVEQHGPRLTPGVLEVGERRQRRLGERANDFLTHVDFAVAYDLAGALARPGSSLHQLAAGPTSNAEGVHSGGLGVRSN